MASPSFSCFEKSLYFRFGDAVVFDDEAESEDFIMMKKKQFFYGFSAVFILDRK